MIRRCKLQLQETLIKFASSSCIHSAAFGDSNHRDCTADDKLNTFDGWPGVLYRGLAGLFNSFARQNEIPGELKTIKFTEVQQTKGESPWKHFA